MPPACPSEPKDLTPSQVKEGLCTPLLKNANYKKLLFHYPSGVKASPQTVLIRSEVFLLHANISDRSKGELHHFCEVQLFSPCSNFLKYATCLIGYFLYNT